MAPCKPDHIVMVNPLIISNTIVKFLIPAVFLCIFGHVTVSHPEGRASNQGLHYSITKHALYLATANLFNDLPLPGISRPISTNITVGPENMFLLYYGNRTCTKTYIYAVDQILDGTEDPTIKLDTWRNMSYRHISENESFPLPDERCETLYRRIFQAAYNGEFTAARYFTGQLLYQLQTFYRQVNSTENEACLIDPAEPTLALPECGPASHQVFSRSMRKTVDGKNNSVSLTGSFANSDSTGSIKSNVCNAALTVAQQKAVNASVHFLERLRDSLGNKRFFQFLGIRGGRTLAIVIDTTQNMGPYLNAVKRRVLELVNPSINDTRNSITDYVLVSFRNHILSSLRTEDPNGFVTQMDKLTADGNHSLVNIGLRAVLTASRLSSEYSGIFVFTEENFNDYSWFQVTISALAQRRQTVYFIGKLAGFTHSDGLHKYQQVAEHSGGQVLQTDGSEENIFRACGIMTHLKMENSTILKIFKRTGDSQKYSVQIDSFIEKFDVMLLHPKAAPVLNVTQSGPNSERIPTYVLVNQIDTVKVYHFDAPTAGNYTFRITENSLLSEMWSASIIGESYFDIVFNLIDLTNCLPNNPEYRIIRTNPTAGQTVILSVRSTCCLCRLEKVFLVLSNGTVQGESLPLTYLNESIGYIAHFTVPDYPFYFKVTGNDENSVEFQRLQANHYIPTSLRIGCNLPTSAQFIPGEVRNISMTIFSTKEALNDFDHDYVTTNVHYILQDDCGFARLLFPRVTQTGWSSAITIQVQHNASGVIQLVVPLDTQPGIVCNVSVTMWPMSQQYVTSLYTDTIVLQMQVVVVSNFNVTNLKPPTCNVTASTLNSCCDAISAECNSSLWHGELEVFDIDSKIISVFTKVEGEGQVRINSSDQSNVFIAANTTAVLNVTGDCRITGVAFRVVDDTGLTGRCSVKRKETSAGLDPPRKPWYGTRQGTLIGVTTVVVLIVVVFVLVTLRLGGYLKSKHNSPWLTVMGRAATSVKRGSQRERAQTNSLELSEQRLDGFLADRIPTHFVVPKWRITINRGSVLGTGYFGKVYLGELTTSTDRSRVSVPKTSFDHQLVAVKTWKNVHNDRFCREFYAEANTMITIGRHPNIVSLLGVCLEDEMSMILENCSNGALPKFLRAARGHVSKMEPVREINYYDNSDPSPRDIENQIVLKEDDLITLCYQICSGMSYISSLGIIHRDLAARNILVDHKMVAKIADFGMAREECEYILERIDVPLPVKWLAPESIQSRIFSSQSDVWSFGIVVWEIFTFAENPYADCCSPTAVEQFYNTLKNGYRLHRPPEIKDPMYELMTKCWEWERENRPTFVELHCDLEKMVDPGTHEHYVTFDNFCY